MKRIAFSPLRFVNDSDSDDLELIKEQIKRESYSLNTYELRLGTYKGAIPGFLAAQDYLASEEVDVNTIARAFKRLSQLDSIDVDIHGRKIGAREITRACGVLGGGEISYDCLHTLEVLVTALMRAEVSIKVFRFGMIEDLNIKERYVSVSLCERELPVVAPSRIISGNYLNSDAIWEAFSNQKDEGLFNAFGKVREVQISKPTRLDVDDRPEVNSALKDLLAVLPLVERLFLDEFTGSNGEMMPRNAIALALTHRTWKHLRELRLDSVLIGKEDLIEIFTRHAPTLQMVHVSQVQIWGSDDWHGVLEETKKLAKFPALESFVIGGTGINDFVTVHAHQYLTGKTDREPVQERAEHERGEIGLLP